MGLNESFELTLTGHAYGGEAFGRDASGRMVFVAFALPGERVRVEVVEAHERWARARLLSVIEPAAERVEQPRCAHFGLCGGCHYQHLAYEAQLRAKAGIVRDQLVRLGGLEAPPVEAAVPSASPWNYRNSLRFSLTEGGRLGFVTHASDGVFAVQECHLPEEAVGDLWPRLELDAAPGLQNVSVRAGGEAERMIVLHADRDPTVELAVDLPASVVWLGPGGAAVLAGEGHFHVEVHGRAFRVSAASFFQTNTALAAELVSAVLEALRLGPGETVFDLYAGVGLFSAFLAEAGAGVVAVEASTSACADFEANLAEFEGVSLYEAPVEEALAEIPEEAGAIVVDPPRAGLGPSVVAEIIRRAPSRLVYVSCDPATLARDAGRLTEGGFRLERVTPFDLFPQTYHIETLSLWTR